MSARLPVFARLLLTDFNGTDIKNVGLRRRALHLVICLMPRVVSLSSSFSVSAETDDLDLNRTATSLRSSPSS